jgi:type IV pilus assembly protein PilY1
VLIGTGDREHPLDSSPTASVLNRFYSLRDNYSNLTPTDVNGTDCDAAGDAVLASGCDLINITDPTFAYSDIGAMKGWVLDLETTKSGATDRTKEQVVTTPTTIGGVTFFSTFQPTDTTTTPTCSNLGTARGYAINFLTGGLAPKHTERATIFTGGGLPPSPVSGLVNVNGKLVPFVVGGKPEAGPGSALEGNTVPINVPSVRRKVYRYNKIDTK